MKKIISLIMTFLLLFISIQPNILAVEDEINYSIDVSKYTDEELDLSQFTTEDIKNMSADEYMDLVLKFEEVYDPYDSYSATLHETSSIQNINLENTVSPLWTSGDYDDDTGEIIEAGCHEYISAKAYTILANDQGFFGNSAVENVVISLLISLASMLPDRDEVGLVAYAGHFYDPDDETNYVGSTTNTAKTNAKAHYKTALIHAKDGDMETAYEYLGRCLHYIQDASEPHHAANSVSTSLNSHAFFEKYAAENAEAFLDGYDSISDGNGYTLAIDSTVAKLTHRVATFAKGKIDTCDSIFNRGTWRSTATLCLKKAAKFSAMIMYRFGQSEYVPFYSN